MIDIIEYKKLKSMTNKFFIILIIIYLFSFDFIDTFNASTDESSLSSISSYNFVLPSVEGQMNEVSMDDNSSNTTLIDEHPVEYYAYPFIFIIGR
jgi:hypothetical protein